MNLELALDRFLVQLKADGRSPHTIAQYRRHIRLLARWMAKEGRASKVERIDHEDLALFLASPRARRSARGGMKKATSLNSLRSSLRCFFAYVHAAGYIPTNPARLIRRAICASPPPRSLSAVEQERLLKALAKGKGTAAERDYALFHLLLATGIRVGSALALEVRDVDLGRREITLRRAKGDRPDRVVLGRAIRQHLRAFTRGRSAGPLFTRNGGGTPIGPRHANRRLQMWLGRAGIKRSLSVHGLRHTFATGLYQRTGDVLLVREALRHRSIASTLVYARPSEANLRVALRA